MTSVLCPKGLSSYLKFRMIIKKRHSCSELIQWFQIIKQHDDWMKKTWSPLQLKPVTIVVRVSKKIVELTKNRIPHSDRILTSVIFLIRPN